MFFRRGVAAGLFTFVLVIASLSRCWADPPAVESNDVAATVRRFFTPVDAYRDEEFVSRGWIEELFHKQQRTGVRRLLSRIEGFDQGDLLSRSQVDDLRSYLRRTRRDANVVDPQLTLRFLPDSNYLVRLYNRGANNATLRRAATELGGYGQLLSLSKTAHGQEVLAEGLSSGRIEEIVQAAEELEELSASDGKGSDDSERRRERWLFTVNELIQEIDRAASEAYANAAAVSGSSPQISFVQ